MEQPRTLSVLVKDLGDDISMPVGELIDQLTDALETAQAQGMSNVKLEFHGGYNDCEPEFEIYATRVETAEEVEKRVKGMETLHEAIRRAREHEERQTYERLKAKFGDAA